MTHYDRAEVDAFVEELIDIADADDGVPPSVPVFLFLTTVEVPREMLGDLPPPAAEFIQRFDALHSATRANILYELSKRVEGLAINIARRAAAASRELGEYS